MKTGTPTNSPRRRGYEYVPDLAYLQPPPPVQEFKHPSTQHHPYQNTSSLVSQAPPVYGPPPVQFHHSVAMKQPGHGSPSRLRKEGEVAAAAPYAATTSFNVSHAHQMVLDASQASMMMMPDQYQHQNMSVMDDTFTQQQQHYHQTNAANQSFLTTMNIAPAQRTVMPLPQHIEKDTPAANSFIAPDGSFIIQGSHHMNNSSSVIMDPSRILTGSMSKRHTYSTAQKARSTSPTGASRSRSALANRTNMNHTATTSAAGSFASAVKAMNRSLHTRDAHCCGFSRQREHEQVKGLYVTFCEQSTEARLINATKDLECEKDARANDAHKNQIQMMRMLRSLNAAEQQRDSAVCELEKTKTETERQLRELKIVRDEFESRYDTSNAKLANLLRETEALRANAENWQISMNNKEKQLMDQDMILRDLRGSLALLDKESKEHAQRAQIYFEEKSILQKKTEALENENKHLREQLELRESLTRGLERELEKANDKLSSVAMMRKSLRRRVGEDAAEIAKHNVATMIEKEKGNRVRQRIGLHTGGH